MSRRLAGIFGYCASILGVTAALMPRRRRIRSNS